MTILLISTAIVIHVFSRSLHVGSHSEIAKGLGIFLRVVTSAARFGAITALGILRTLACSSVSLIIVLVVIILVLVALLMGIVIPAFMLVRVVMAGIVIPAIALLAE